METCKYKFPLQKDNLCLNFRALPGSTDSQKPLAQANPCAQEAYFGVPCSGAPHLLGRICRESDQSHFAVRRVTLGRPRPSRPRQTDSLHTAESGQGKPWVTAGQPRLTIQQSRWDGRPEASGRKGPREKWSRVCMNAFEHLEKTMVGPWSRGHPWKKTPTVPRKRSKPKGGDQPRKSRRLCKTPTMNYVVLLGSATSSTDIVTTRGRGPGRTVSAGGEGTTGTGEPQRQISPS